MLFGEADIYIKSDKSLEEIGDILSRELFAGLPFGGRENCIRDEIPAIYIEPQILGLDVILIGGDVDGVTILQIFPSDRALDYSAEEFIDKSKSDLNQHLKFVLRKVDGIKIMSEDEIKEFESQFES